MDKGTLKKQVHLFPGLLSLIVLAVILVLGFVAYFNHSLAWFSSNRDTSATGMGVKVKGKNFDLITLSNDTTNKKGVYYDPYHAAIQENESEAYDIWLVDSGSNINNYTNTGRDDGTLGIEPGSSGVIKFYIKPYQDVTVEFAFETIGYNSSKTTVGGKTQVTMTELSSEADESARFLNGHVLLFEGYDESTSFYSGLIPTGSDGKRVFSREFQLNGSYDADTDGDSASDAYEVDIYWIWPETLDALVYNSNSTTTTICDRNAVASSGEDNDYTKVVNNICTYPQYYLKNYSLNTTYTEALVSGRNITYNDADQDIGMNIEYILLRLGAKDSSGN